MKSLIRKIRSYLALFSLAISLALAPVFSYAFVPPALGWMGALGGGGAVAETAAAANPVGATLVALGIGYVLYKKFSDTPNDCTRIAITNVGMCNPDGWTNGNPPSTAAIQRMFQYQGVNYSNNITPCNIAGYSGPYAGDPNELRCKNGYGNPVSIGMSRVDVCPAGYTSNGSICNLTNASLVQKPTGTPCQISMVSGSWTYDAQNPACPTVATNPITVSGTGLTISPDGKTLTAKNGNYTSTSTINNTDNSLTINQFSPMTDDLGNPITQNTTTTINNINTTAPTVTNNTTYYTNGHGSGTSTTPVQPQNKVSCADLSNCNWSNLETQQKQLVEEQKIASATTEIASSSKNISDFLTKNDIPTDDIPTETNDIAFTWSAISLPASCPQPRHLALSFGSYDFSYQPICDVASALKPILVACAAISGLYICFGGRRDAS